LDISRIDEFVRASISLRVGG